MLQSSGYQTFKENYFLSRAVAPRGAMQSLDCVAQGDGGVFTLLIPSRDAILKFMYLPLLYPYP